MDNITPEMEVLKTRLKATWMSGNYAEFAKSMERGALKFLKRIEIQQGETMLDIGCGAGQIAIPAARAGVRVTGADIATNLIVEARSRAAAENLEVRFDEADAEMLPYADASFDVVVSLIGVMFAPQPDKVVTEMLRVCRPNGRIVMANWTPEGFVGQLFKTISKYVPPSPLMPSPMLWGNESTVRERFQKHAVDLKLTKRQYPFRYEFGPAEVVEFYQRYYGPTNRAFAALDPEKQAALRSELEGLWTEHNQGISGTTQYEAEYLEVIAIKPSPSLN